MLVSLLKKVGIALFILGLGLAPAAVQADNKTSSLAGTIWSGEEKLKNHGPLMFGFDANGRVYMVDARSNPNNPKTFVRGTWTQNGDQVEVRFDDCVYRGRINGDQMTGSASFNGRQDNWTFDLRLTPKQPQQPR